MEDYCLIFRRAQIFAWVELFISGGAGIACPDSKCFHYCTAFRSYSSRKWITFAWLRGNFKCSTRINKYSPYAFMCTLKGGENPERDSENKSLWHSSPRQRLLAQCLLGFLSGSPDCSEFALWFSFFRKWGILTENRRSIAFERPIKCGRRAINYFQQSEIAAWVRNLLGNVMWKFVESRSKKFVCSNSTRVRRWNRIIHDDGKWKISVFALISSKFKIALASLVGFKGAHRANVIDLLWSIDRGIFFGMLVDEAKLISVILLSSGASCVIRFAVVRWRFWLILDIDTRGLRPQSERGFKANVTLQLMIMMRIRFGTSTTISRKSLCWHSSKSPQSNVNRRQNIYSVAQHPEQPVTSIVSWSMFWNNSNYQLKWGRRIMHGMNLHFQARKKSIHSSLTRWHLLLLSWQLSEDFIMFSTAGHEWLARRRNWCLGLRKLTQFTF